MQQIANWLKSLGLGEYAQRFAKNRIDASVLRDLTDQDLEKIGIPLGHRKKMLRAIAELGAAALATPQAPTGPNRQDTAERRRLTVMLCDLVGSTALSARLDPEDMRAVIDAYHAACARIVLNYEGFLAEFRGDGILAYFGYPRAHEDDAERTVRAGLEIIAAVAGLETRAAEPLAVRIGVATGLVVVGNLSGEDALREHAVVGDTPNLAARLESLAEPGTIVVAGSTRRLLGNLFRLRDLGRHEVKGMAEPVEAWAVEGVSISESRFESVHPAGLTDLTDRKEEIGLLLERQRLAWKGEGQIVLISGEPGIGKSRLAAALAEHIIGEPYTHLRFQCSPYHTNSALHPVIAQLERAARVQDRRYARATPRQAGSAPRHSTAGSSRSAALCCAAVDPVRRAVSPAGAQSHAAASADARGIARSIRGFSPPTTDPAPVRGRALGGCHHPRAARSGCRASAPATGPCTVHLPSGVRAALGWSAQCRHFDTRPPRTRRR